MLNLNRGGKSVLWLLLGIVVVLLLIGGTLMYYIFGDFNAAEGKFERGVLRNPLTGLSDEEAVEQFDESFVTYMLYNIGANELHKPPLSKDTPEIELLVGEKVYSAEIVKGIIIAEEGGIPDEDIVIITSAEEAVEMIKDRNYIFDSFASGESKIELVAGKFELASKGYFGIYKELTGENLEE